MALFLRQMFWPLVAALLYGIVCPAHADESIIRLATTTSTENSGLLAVLLPPFEKQSGLQVQVIAVGTGKALRMGRDGDVDVVLVHARDAEERFIAAGHGINRRQVMYNDFVILGPRADPAGIDAMQDAVLALRRIAAGASPFVSRGDESGTHKKEQSLWQTAGSQPTGGWYRQVGQGMGQTLQIAAEMQAYTLCDRGTWLAYRGKTDLQVLVEGDRRLYNPYGIIAVNPDKYPDINYFGAMRLIAWVTSVPGQTLIRHYRIKGEALFIPMAITGRQ